MSVFMHQILTVCANCVGTSPLNLNQRVSVAQGRAFALLMENLNIKPGQDLNTNTMSLIV